MLFEGCDTTRSDPRCKRYDCCRGDPVVEECIIPGAGHSLRDLADMLDVPAHLCTRSKRTPRPEEGTRAEHVKRLDESPRVRQLVRGFAYDLSERRP